MNEFWSVMKWYAAVKAISLAVAFIVVFAMWCCGALGQTQLMSPERLAAFRRLIPEIADPEYRAALQDPQAFFYTQGEIPRAEQWIYLPQNRPGFSRPTAINLMFPWNTTGGMDYATNVESFKVMRLPTAGNGVPWPVVTYREQLQGATTNARGVKWIFPIGTEFYEVLYMKDSKGFAHVFEIRVRLRKTGFWDVDRLVPISNEKQWLAEIGKIDPALAAQVSEPRTVYVETLSDHRNRNRSGFKASKAVVDYLPPIPESVSVQLLHLPFKSALGDFWKETAAGKVTVPMGDQAFGIRPKGDMTCFLGNDHISCRQCHGTALVAARTFDGNRRQNTWARGSADSIISFHPLSRQTVDDDQIGPPPRVRLNPTLFQAGMVANYNSNVHVKQIYSRLDRQEKPIQ